MATPWGLCCYKYIHDFEPTNVTEFEKMVLLEQIEVFDFLLLKESL
jgi:hypothetical protein